MVLWPLIRTDRRRRSGPHRTTMSKDIPQMEIELFASRETKVVTVYVTYLCVDAFTREWNFSPAWVRSKQFKGNFYINSTKFFGLSVLNSKYSISHVRQSDPQTYSQCEKTFF